MKHRYFTGEVEVSQVRFNKVAAQLDLSDMDWEIDYAVGTSTIYILQ